MKNTKAKRLKTRTLHPSIFEWGALRVDLASPALSQLTEVEQYYVRKLMKA